MNYHGTSTPLLNSYKGVSFPASQSPSRLTPTARSPKYLIASPTCGTPLRRPLERGASPMLNSTVNVSLYTNVQSPGLVSRIVQYDHAQNRGSHNKKFASPGLFPIVHLYKQSVPIVSPKPKRVTVKIAPPDDLSMYDHVEHAIIMSDNARITTMHEQPSNGTRSVLDALKEISRKRIHSAAEFESTSLEDGNRKRNKRILETAELVNSTNKRAREESPPTDTKSPSPINGDKNTPKRYCSIDPITASFTSANLRLQELRKDVATRAVEEYRDDLPESPLRKTQQVSVDTQTTCSNDQFEREIVETPPIKRQIHLESENFAEAEVESPLFDPKPLEIIRRNKLAALLGAICGEVPILEKPQVLIDAPRDEINNSLPITSILSNTTKIPKEPKHVTFDLPIVTANPLMAITQTTTALIMPIPSTMIAPFRDTTATISSHPPPSVVSVNSSSSVPSNITPAPKIVGGFKFDLTVPIASSALNFAPATLPTVSQSVSVKPTTSADVPKFDFQFISAQSNDLETNKPQNLVSTFTQPIPSANSNISFGTQPIALTSNSTFNFGNSQVDPPKSFTFNAISTPVALTTTQLKETITTSSVPLFSSTTATTNMFLKPTVALSSSPFQTEPINGTNPGFGIGNSNLTTANSVGFPLKDGSTTATTTTKFDIGSSNNIFAATTASGTFSFGGGNNVVPLTSTINFGNTVEKVASSFAVPAAVTTSTNNIFGSLPFGSSPPAVSTSNFVGFGSGIKELTQPAPASIKFGETAVKTVAISPPTTSLFSFGGSTSTDIQQQQKPSAFNQLKDNIVANGFPTSSKLTFADFRTHGFGTDVPPNQTFSFGGNANTFGPPPTNANFNKSANFDVTFGGQQFNAPPTFAGQQTKLFSFGAATAIPKTVDPLATVEIKPSGVFAFGTPTVVKPQPTSGGGGFNFSAGAGYAAPAPAPVMFGSPAFNVGGFNAPAMVGSPGMFSIGTGSSSGPSRPRTQLKTKRRT